MKSRDRHKSTVDGGADGNGMEIIVRVMQQTVLNKKCSFESFTRVVKNFQL